MKSKRVQITLDVEDMSIYDLIADLQELADRYGDLRVWDAYDLSFKKQDEDKDEEDND